MDKEQSGVPAAPNESKVRGRIVDIEPGPEGIGSIWKVEVNESLDVGILPNFTRAYIGKVISIFIHPNMKETLKVSDWVEARISFQGDERCGAFFLIDDDVHKL